MEKTKRKSSFLFLKMFAAMIILSLLGFYAYSFPKTMELLDNKVNEIIDFADIEFEFSLFSKLSDFAGKTIELAEYYYETIKDNLEDNFPDTDPLPVFIFSCAAEFPLENKNITSLYGKRTDPISGKKDLHTGMDIAVAFGSDVIAAWPGEIFETGFDEIYGKYIIIRHAEGFFSKYCHLSEIEVQQKDFVNAGEKIGEAGSTGRSTGSHLHFEVEIDGRNIDPMECFDF